MANKQASLCFARHGRYGSDTFIDRQSMLEAFLQGKLLKNIFSDCETVYHSPIPRAVQTANFLALGMNCSHLVEAPQLSENEPTFGIQKFITGILLNTEGNKCAYLFVTHLPVIEKIGLPDLGCGEMCLCNAENTTEMLAENFTTQKIPVPNIDNVVHLMEQINVSADELNRLSADEIYSRLSLLVQ